MDAGERTKGVLDAEAPRRLPSGFSEPRDFPSGAQLRGGEAAAVPADTQQDECNRKLGPVVMSQRSLVLSTAGSLTLSVDARSDSGPAGGSPG